MINKENLWFITLFSLILVLGIYYVTMKDDELKVSAVKNNSSLKLDVTEVDSLVALRVEEEEMSLKEIEELQTILLDEKTTIEEKNDAYENLQALNTQKGKVEEVEKLIKNKFSLDSFVKIKNDQINIVIAGKNHDTSLANEIIRSVQEKYTNQMYITVKFQP